MNDDQARCHKRAVVLAGRSGTSFLQAHLEPDDFIARGLQSGLTAA
jgi:hypothetical protein